MSANERIEIELLEALDALLTDLNVTRAAKRLGITQPALSARLTRLRDIFGDRLFIPAPTGRGVLATPRALALAPMASEVLSQMATMLRLAAFDAAKSQRTFTIALHENPAVMFSPALIRRIPEAAPGVRLVLVFPDKERMTALLESGEVDLFVGSRSNGDKAWLSRTLLEDSFVTAQRKDHPRGSDPLDLDGFCAGSHLLVSSEGDPFSGVVDKALAELDRRRTVTVSIQSYAVAPVIIAASDLLCTLPGHFLQRFAATLDLFPPPVALPPIEVTAYWHPRLHEDPGHQWLRAQLFAVAAAGRLQAP